MMYLLTASGLTPGGSCTVHIYAQTIHRMTQNKQYIEQHKSWEQYKNFGIVWAVPRLGELYPGIRLTTEEKAWKNLSQSLRCFSMVTAGTRTCINVALYIRCLSCPSESGTPSLLYFCVVPDAVILCMTCHPILTWYRKLQSGRLHSLCRDRRQSHSAVLISVFKKTL